MLAIFSIVIFLSNTLKNHLDRVKRNLGNFMAFGTTGMNISIIYILVVIRILMVSTVIALFLAYLSGEISDRYLLRHILILDRGLGYFSLFNSWLMLFIILVYSVAVLKTVTSVIRLVRKPPGDLIYEREIKSGLIPNS
ncbi:MAG: hypothetical protein WCO44_16175 [Bacteroidota bacterium]